MKTYKITHIRYDFAEREDLHNMAKELFVDVPNDANVEDYLSDAISDATGFCHFGFSYQEVRP
jgi:tRNA A58 N-methylase Trm61